MMNNRQQEYSKLEVGKIYRRQGFFDNLYWSGTRVYGLYRVVRRTEKCITVECVDQNLIVDHNGEYHGKRYKIHEKYDKSGEYIQFRKPYSFMSNNQYLYATNKWHPSDHENDELSF